MPNARILLVEDEFLIRLTLAEALIEEGFDIVEADNGDDALEFIVGQSAFDLLLTDVQIPGVVDGLALARAARERIPGLPVIFVTGRPANLGDVGAGRDIYIAKPYLPSDICVAARRLLATGASASSQG